MKSDENQFSIDDRCYLFLKFPFDWSFSSFEGQPEEEMSVELTSQP